MQYNSPRKKNKYQFVNRYNCIVKTTDKALFFYKIGLDRIFWSIDYLCEHPTSKNYGKEIVIKVKAILYLDVVIKMENLNLSDEAKDKIKWANEIKDRITKYLV